MKKSEELLAQVLEECLEEDLSFVPPEGEIARKHKFSDKFEKAMERVIADSLSSRKEREIKKHFSPRYGHLAAGVLIFCVCGWMFWSLMDSLVVEKEAAETMDTAVKLEETTAEETGGLTEESETEDMGEPTETAGNGAQEKIWCGQSVYYAAQQEVPEMLENVTTLVNCPVLEEEDPIVYLTIGNVGEEPVQYVEKYELEVQLEDGWYVIPEASSGSGEKKHLEAGMAVDLEVNLSEYALDHRASRYRLVVYVDQEPVSAEFTFEEVFSEKMEKLEEDGSSGE